MDASAVGVFPVFPSMDIHIDLYLCGATSSDLMSVSSLHPQIEKQDGATFMSMFILKK